MKVLERRKNISRLACKYLPLINDVVARNNPDLEHMLDLHKKIFDLNEENGFYFVSFDIVRAGKEVDLLASENIFETILKDWAGQNEP